MINIGFISSALNIFDKIVSYIPFLHKILKKKYRKMSHYFKSYHKHLTIYKDGTGIIINSFDIVFNNTNTEPLKRAINIEDGKKSASFPSLKKMKSVKIDNRFKEYGLWYYSDRNIISSTSEKYWSDDDDLREDVKTKNNDKELRWVLNFNSSKIEIGKPYHVIYVMSIPNMFPISDGIVDINAINDPNQLVFDDYNASSSIKITHKIEKMLYTVSFESGIILESEPECSYTQAVINRKEHPKLENDDNIIYKKYICNINKPTIDSKIIFKWKFKGGN